MIKAVRDEISELPEAVAALYKLNKSGALKGRYVLEVDPVDGVELVDVGPLRAEEGRLAEALERHLVDAAISKAVDRQGGNRVLLEPHLKARARLDRATLNVAVFGEDGAAAYFNNKGEPGTLDDIVDDLRKKPAFSRAFSAPAPEAPKTTAPATKPWGSGSLTEHMQKVRETRRHEAKATQPEVTNNPWRKSTWNLTAQMAVLRSDPTRAAMLRAEAEAA